MSARLPSQREIEDKLLSLCYGPDNPGKLWAEMTKWLNQWIPLVTAAEVAENEVRTIYPEYRRPSRRVEFEP